MLAYFCLIFTNDSMKPNCELGIIELNTLS